MPTWVYEARDATGKTVRGAHDAADRSAALEFLRAQGLFLTRLEASGRVAPLPRPNPAPRSSVAVPTGPPVGVPPRVTQSGAPSAMPALQNHPQANPPLSSQPMLRASSKDLSNFFRQMGAMTHAGTTLGAALHSMREHAPNAALRNASTQIESRVMSGETLSNSMRAFPGLFSPLQIGMIRAGERGGFIVEMFQRLAKYAERDYELQQTVKRETWYPKLLVFAAFLIPSAVPFVVAMVNKTGNPFLSWLQAVWAPFFLIGITVFLYRSVNYAAPLVAHQSALKLTLDRFKLMLPIGGKVVRGLATAKFCRALGTLYAAGVGPREAVKLSAEACGNAAIADATIRVIPLLEQGETLTSCLKSTGHFPSTVMQVMAVGEQSGNLDEQLDKAADFLEADAEVAIKQSVQVFSILIFLAIALYIGFQVAQFYLGYFNSVMDQGEQMAQ